MRVVGPLWLLAAIAAVVVGVGGLWRGYDIGFGSEAIVLLRSPSGRCSGLSWWSGSWAGSSPGELVSLCRSWRPEADQRVETPRGPLGGELGRVVESGDSVGKTCGKPEDGARVPNTCSRQVAGAKPTVTRRTRDEGVTDDR